MIQTYGLTKTFKDLTAVSDLSIRVDGGDIMGFIGPNGAGKTTTIKMLATLIRPTSGHAEICGCNVTTEPDQVKRLIGYMPDFFGVYDDMKVWEYLDFFAAAYKIERARRREVIHDVLELTDLTGKRDDYVESLSRGMKQRLCLAKTLIHDPSVLLLDEPASGLDPRARIEMRELLKELRGMGKTILVSSHILTELADFCTTVAIIEKGQLLVSGAVDEILRQLQANRGVEVVVGSDPSHARDVLLGIPGVKAVEVDGSTLMVELMPGIDDTSVILEGLVKGGVKTQSVKESEIDLEEVFMRVTKGVVQ